MNNISNILIVDDEPINLTILELSLDELENINIVSALDGFKALEYVREIPIDLIILELSMPELGGLEGLSGTEGGETP